MSNYVEPKAKKIYVTYDIDDPDDLMAYRTIEQAVEADGLDVGAGDVIAVYQLVELVEVDVVRKITKKTIKI